MQNFRKLDGNTNCNILFGRRILFFCAVFFLIGGLIAGELSISARYAYLSAGAFCLVFVLFRKMKYSRIALYLGVMFLAMGMMTGFFGNLEKDFSRLTCNIVEGTVTEKACTQSGNAKYKLTDVTSGGNDLGHCVYVYTEDDGFALGDILKAEGSIRQPAGKSYPFDFDMRSYCASEDVSLVVYAEFIEKTGDAQTLSAKLDRFRLKLGEKLDVLYGKYSGIAKAMLIGMDEEIDPAEKNAYQQAGISHILCISGLHMSVIGGAVYLLLKKLRASRLLSYCLSVGVLIGYAVLAGGAVSVVRAAVMHVSLLTAAVVRRRGDMLTALATAFLLCVLGNPAAVYGLGFQLSYGCVFTMICLGECFGKNKISASVGTALCGLLTTSLILWNVNNSFSPVSLIFNLIAVPIAGVAVIVLFVSALIFCIFGGVTVYLGYAGKGILWLLNTVAGWSEQLNWEIPVKGVQGICIFLIFIGIFLVSRFFIAKRTVKLICFCVLTVPLILALTTARDAALLNVEFLPYEYGDTAVISDDEGNCVIIDAGSPYGLDYLRAYGMEADAVFLSGEKDRQIGSLREYLHMEIYAPRELTDGTAYALSDKISILPIIAEDDSQADYLICYEGEPILLYMGAAPQERESPHAEVIKISSDSKKNIAFAGKVGAKYVILREHTERFPSIAVNDGGVVSVRCGNKVIVERNYDGGTVFATTES